MNQRWLTILLYVAAAAAVLAALVYAFLPAPVLVETASVARGDLEVVVAEDGKTRIREKYIVSAPLTGRLARVTLHPGDPVRAGETVLVALQPIPPAMLDARARAEAVARLHAAEAAVKRTDPAIEQARAAARLAEEEFSRAQKLFERDGVSHEDRDRAELKFLAASETLKSAVFAQQIAQHELELARAALLYTQAENPDAPPPAEAPRLEIRAPISGRVLRVLQESSTVVAAGVPLIEVGDAADLEVVVDALSSDAVTIAPGNRVELDAWGGPVPLKARVRYVEPSGFTKISALGVEEQRVNVIIDLVDPPEKRPTLGDDFRVEARIITAQARGVLKAPTAAIFRHGQQSAVYVLSAGRAVMRPISLGRTGPLESEITDGLSEGDQVIVYPSDKVTDGRRAQLRPLR